MEQCWDCKSGPRVWTSCPEFAVMPVPKGEQGLVRRARLAGHKLTLSDWPVGSALSAQVPEESPHHHPTPEDSPLSLPPPYHKCHFYI